MLGGVGSGKTYPAMHEAIFHCIDNPKHDFAVIRNTWDSLKDSGLEEDMVEICERGGIIKKYNTSDHEIILFNNCKIMFRPLTLKKRVIKGWHLCGFLIDDPDVALHQNTISFLWSRLRDSHKAQAKRFQSIITANWEGKDWLYKTYVKGREHGGDDAMAYWIIPTAENPTLSEHYIEDMELVHSEAWIKRYILCEMDSYSGLIYPMFNREIHHMDYREILKKAFIRRIKAIDVGISHPNVVYDEATDGQNIYIWGESYERDWETSDLGNYLVREHRENVIHHNIIDPSYAKRDQTSGLSPKQLLSRKFGIFCKPANNNVDFGIGIMRDLFKPMNGSPRIFVDLNQCKNFEAEISTYRFEQPTFDDDDSLIFSEKPDKKRGNDDCMDAARYGVCELVKYLADYGHRAASDYQKEKRVQRRQERFQKLRHCREHPEKFRKLELVETYRRQGYSMTTIRRLLKNIKYN